MNTSDKCSGLRANVRSNSSGVVYNVHADVGVQDGCHGV